jgi:hypothetical protein
MTNQFLIKIILVSMATVRTMKINIGSKKGKLKGVMIWLLFAVHLEKF